LRSRQGAVGAVTYLFYQDLFYRKLCNIVFAAQAFMLAEIDAFAYFIGF
jgi:hypothetical protein